MTQQPYRVCVFCAASSTVSPAIKNAGAALGRGIAEAGMHLTYGGTTCGLMLIVADAHRTAGGHVTGVVPRFMVDNGIANPGCHTLVPADDLRDRKARMHDHADAFAILPGGVGTLDEFFETFALKQLGMHHKPIVLVDVDGFFQPLIALIEHGIAHNTIKPEHRDYFKVATTASEAVKLLRP